MDKPQFGDDELIVLLREVGSIIDAGTPGDIVELGCYKGETSVHLARLLKRKASDKRLYIYDSFEGLPEKRQEDNSPAGTQFRSGELLVTKREVVRKLKSAGFNDVRVKKGWFSDLTQADLPEQIALAFLDGDFYESISESLKLVWPLLSPGAVVVVDDYYNEALPGVRRALDIWAADHQFNLKVESSLAIIRPGKIL